MKPYIELFTTFFKMGLFSIGGGLAMLPLIQRVVVEERQWMTAEEMVDCVAVCQSLPGVIAVNAATYIGKARKGMPGALVASLGVILPSFVIIILAVLFLREIGESARMQGAFTALKAASCGLILYAAYTVGKQVLRGFFAWVVAVVSFLMIAFFGISALWAILLGGVAGALYTAIKARTVSCEMPVKPVTARDATAEVRETIAPVEVDAQETTAPIEAGAPRPPLESEADK